jgi:hypothetical protein
MIEAQAKTIDALALLSEALNFDFGSMPMDQPFTAEQLDNISGLRGILDRVVAATGNAKPTLDDFVKISKRGTLAEFNCICGSPKQVADVMEQWFVERACDGFVLAAPVLPGSYEDITRLVVPELQRRGLHHTDYRGKTLRDNLQLGRAERGDWR